MKFRKGDIVLENEEYWKSLDEIVDNGTNYEVSTTGKVRNVITKYELSQSKGSHGYYMVTLSNSGDCKKYLVHRLVLLTFVDKPLDKEIVNHIDGNKENNTLQNLEWMTRAENNRHAWDPNLFNRDKHKKSASITGKITGIINIKFAQEATRRSVTQFDNQGNMKDVFVSAAEASRITGVKRATISRQCSKETESRLYEFYFRYTDEITAVK